MKTLTLWQYFKLNRQTTFSCLKICTVIFTTIATLITLWVEYAKGDEQNPLIVFVACELFGYGFALFIFLLAMIEGYAKARLVLKRYNMIPEKVRTNYSIELIKKNLNPKYWFMQFEIVQVRNGEPFELDEQTKRLVLDQWI